MALLPECKNYNILLLGRTGVGKSTFINAFANYFTYKTFDEALEVNEPICLIPTSFNMTYFTDFSSLNFTQFGINKADIDNECMHVAHSATKKPRIYSFYKNNAKFNFIDTPGMESTFGIFKDIENKELIINIMKKFKQIHCILILINASEYRIEPQLYYLNEIMMLFHVNALSNMMVVLTNSRGQDYSPVTVLSVLKSYEIYLQEMNGITLELNENTIFCVDNEGYKFQCGWNKSEKYRSKMGFLIENYKRSWEFSKNQIIKSLSLVISNVNTYDVSLSLNIEKSRSIIYEGRILCSTLDALIPSDIQNPTNFIDIILKYDIEIKNVMNAQDNLSQNFFKPQKYIDFASQNSPNIMENDDILHIQPSSDILDDYPLITVDIKKGNNLESKKTFLNVVAEHLTREDAEDFFQCLQKNGQNIKIFIEEVNDSLSQYLKQNAILLYNNKFRDRVDLEILKEENALINENTESAEMITKLERLRGSYNEVKVAIESSLTKCEAGTERNTTFPEVFNFIDDGINLSKLNNEKKIDDLLLQICYLMFKTSLYFGSNFHQKVIFISPNASSTIPILKAMTNNFDCFFIDDCFAFNEMEFHGLRKPKKYLLEFMDQMIAVIDVPTITQQDQESSRTLNEFVNTLSKINAVCLFIEFHSTKQEIVLENYLTNLPKTALNNIFFVVNISDISYFDMTEYFFQMKETIEKFNRENNVDIKFENENVFIFNNDAVDELMEMIEMEEGNNLKIRKSLYENCKNSFQELERFLATLLSTLPPKTKSYEVKLGDKVLFFVELTENKDIQKILNLEKEIDEVELEIVKNSVKTIHTFDLPATKVVLVKLDLKWDEKNTFEIMPVCYAVTITPNIVAIYDPNSNDSHSFPALIDYGNITPLIGVDYDSPTVVKDAITALGLTVIPKNLSTKMTSFTLRGFPELLYSIQRNQTPHFVNPESVISEFLKEATKNVLNKNDTLLLTIPRHYNEAQKAAYLKAAEYANLTNIKFVDEIIAFAHGFEKLYEINENINYVLIHYFYPYFTVSTMKSGNILFEKELSTFQIEFEAFKEWETGFFDEILENVQTDVINNKLPDECQRIFDIINESIVDSWYVVISGSSSLHKLVADFVKNIDTIFIENAEELIASGANLAFN